MISILDVHNTTDLELFYSIGSQIRSQHEFQEIPWSDDLALDKFANDSNCAIELIVYQNQEKLGRVAAFKFKDKPEGIIGWYECSESEEVSKELLNRATQFLKEQSCKSVIGPINGNTWNSYRFNKTAEKPLMPGDPYQPLYYITFWESFGFNASVYYQTDTAPKDLFEPMTMAEGQQLAKQFNLSVDHYPEKATPEFLEQMHWFYHECFSGNPLFDPIELDDYGKLSEKLLQIFDHKHSLLVRNREGNPVAVTLSYRDIYHQLHKAGELKDADYQSNKLLIKTIATHPEYQGKQIGTLMINLVHNLANETGFDSIYHLLMYKDNLSATKGKEKFVTTCVRQYALYSLEL